MPERRRGVRWGLDFPWLVAYSAYVCYVLLIPEFVMFHLLWWNSVVSAMYIT